MKYILILLTLFGLLNTFSFEKTILINQISPNSIFPYYGILEIPVLNLKQGFYPYASEENDVNKNIELISKNCLLNQACNFILASHSGNADISFFKHLDRLNIKDQAIIYFNNQKYYYYLESIQYQEKNGTMKLIKPTESKLVLTTCNKTNQTLQNIYIFKQKK